MKDHTIPDIRPHLVMAVGNAALGDSRVEKAAISARDNGYKVTVLAIRRANTEPLGFIDNDIPVLRVPKGKQHYTSKMQNEVRPRQTAARLALESVTAQKHVVATLESQVEVYPEGSLRSKLRVRGQLKKARKRLIEHTTVAENLVQSETADFLERYPEDGQWIEIWPEIADYRDAFYAGFVQLEPDLIHVHDIHPMAGADAYCIDAAGWGKNVKWLYDAHEWLPGQDFYKIPPARHLGWSKMEFDLASKAAKVLTVSERMADQLQERLQLAELPGVVYNAPMLKLKDTTLAPRKPVREECGLHAGDPLMVYVGGINPRRGTLTMVDALAHHSSLHAVFVANRDVGSRTAIRKRAQELGVADRVHIREYVPADSVSSYIKSADVGISALLPTAAHHQAAPTKVREYMLAGLPVVVSDMKVQGELVDRLGIGEVFPAGNAVALAESVERCLQNKGQYTSRYTDELLLENSWDSCVPTLKAAWDAISPVNVREPSVSKPQRRIYVDIQEDGPFGSILPVLESNTDYEFIFSTAALQMSTDVPTNTSFYGTPGVRPVLDIWREKFANLHGIVSDRPNEMDLSSLAADIRGSLRRIGVRSVSLKVNDDSDDLNYARKSFPNHYVHDYSSAEFSYQRLLHREQRTAELITQQYFASPSPLTARSYRTRGLYLPYPIVNYAEKFSERADIESLLVGVLPATRSHADLSAVKEVLGYSGPEFKARLIEASIDLSDLSDFDIVIDSLGVDYPGFIGAAAMAQGAAILTGRHASRAYPHQLRALPSMRSRPTELMQLLVGVGREAVEEYRRGAFLYAEQNYQPETVANQLIRVLNDKFADATI